MAELNDPAPVTRPTQRLKWRLGEALDPVPLLVAPLWSFGLLAVMAVPFASGGGWHQERDRARLSLRPAETSPRAATTEVIRVRLRSDVDGRLTQMTIGNRDLGADDAAFDQLRWELLGILGRMPDPLPADLTLEIDADFELEYRHVLRVVEEGAGQVDPTTGQLVRFVERVQFAPPRPPRGSAAPR